MENEQKNSRIIIVGAGLVGSLAAVQLGKLGHEIELYEYRDDIRKSSQSVGRSINLALSMRGRRALRDVGLEDTVLANALPMRGRMLHDIKGNTKPTLYDPVGKQCIYSVGRKFLNEVLLNAAEQLPNVQVNFNRKVTSANLQLGEITFQDMNEKSYSTNSAQLVLGADGAFSKVRQQLMKLPGFNFAQTYIEHGYLELCIPSVDNKFAMDERFLHIWPRGQFMMIALPNDKDKSWTVTLFMPFRNFESILSDKDLIRFFEKYFPDAIPLIGKQRLIEDFFKTKPQYLVQVKCSPYHAYGKFLLIGDAAHAMVPFYGQGMNAGFEDVTLLKELFLEYNGDLPMILPAFTDRRWKDAHAICDLAMYNYTEMRDLVTKTSFIIRKQIDGILFRIFGDKWIPLYNSVSFSKISYNKCIENRKNQDRILSRFGLMFLTLIGGISTAFVLKYKSFNILA